MEAPVPIPTTLPILLRYYPIADALWAGVQLFAIAIPLFLLFTGLGGRLRAWAGHVAGERWYPTLAVFACAYLILAALIALPLNYFYEIPFKASWGAPVPSLMAWVGDWVLGLGASLIAAVLLLWIPYGLARLQPKNWRWLTALAAVPFLLLFFVGYKIWGVPQRPLPDGVLAHKIAEMAARCGETNVPVFVGGQAGENTVVGLGPTNRILLPNDLFELPLPQQFGVVAHELKHYVLNDNWKAFALLAVLILAGLWLVDRVGRAMIRGNEKRFGFADLADPGSLPLVLFIVMAGWLFVGLPLFNTVQRHVEFEADRFALEISHENRARAELQFKNGQYTLNNENWFHRFWRDNHPTPAERVAFANSYHPWTEGKPLVYAKVCRMD